MTLHCLNEVANDAESTQKSTTTLKIETMGKLMNRILGFDNAC